MHITPIKSANLRSHLSRLLTYEKTISCKYVNYFLITGKPALLYIHYNMAIGLNELISGFARLHPRRMELANILSAFGASLANRSVFILDQRL